MLSLRLLGPIELVRDGTVVALPRSRKTRALLAYLCMAEKPLQRSQLISQLWEIPDDPRGALRWSLSKLREIVDDDVKRIVANRETVFFDPVDVSVDARFVQALVSRDPGAAETSELELAAAMFRGPFLEGLELADSPEYHTWHLARISEFERARYRILDSLCERHTDAPRQALPFAEQLAALSPDEDDVQARLEAIRSQAREHAHRSSGPKPGSGDGATDNQDTAAILQRSAVAVLPFTNMSGDAEQDYFADGITEDIITGLCNWRWFPVIARNSTFAFKGQHVDIVNVGKQLGARYVLEGSVRRAGNRVRVTAQLIDASQGHHIWAQRYDRELDDVFAIQDELTEQIVAQIEPALARSERLRTQHVSTTNLDAWDLNHRALAAIYRGRSDDLDAAETLLRQSMTLDPTSSHSHALLALCHYHRALLVWHRDPYNAVGVFADAAQDSVALDQGNWLGHALLGLGLLWRDRDYLGAAEETRKSAELNPSAALAHQFLGCVLNFDGHPADAIPHLEAAVRLNPHPNAATLLLSDLALAHVLLGRFEEAVPYAKRAIAHFSGDIRAWQRLCAALGHLQRHEEAAEALANLQRYQRRLSIAYIDATYPFRYAHDREILIDGLQKAGWTSQD